MGKLIIAVVNVYQTAINIGQYSLSFVKEEVTAPIRGAIIAAKHRWVLVCYLFVSEKYSHAKNSTSCDELEIYIGQIACRQT